MIHFIYIGMLAGLAGVLLPLIIHLFARRKYRRIEFSTTVFLKEIQNQKMRQVRLRQVLLLIFRCLAVLFIVLAFARPTLTGHSGPLKAKSQSSMVVVMDRSFSMRRPGLFDKAQNRALALAELLESGDEAMILWCESGNPTAEPAFYQREDILRDRIFQHQPSWENANLYEGIRRAAAHLDKSSNINKEIVLISDFQASSFRDTISAGGWDGSLFMLQIPSERDNVTILEGGIDNIIQPSLPVEIYCIVKNYGGRKINDLVARVYISGEPAAQKTISLNSGEQKRIAFRVSPGSSGWIPGSIRLDNDSFTWDDIWYFSLFVPDRREVLILGGGDNDIQPFRLSLKPDRRGTGFEIKTALYGEDWTDGLASSDVLIITNFPNLNFEEAAHIRKFVRNGGGLFIAPGDRTGLKSLNENLVTPLSGQKNILMGEPIGTGEAQPFLSIDHIDADHPILKGVFEPGMENVRSPHFYKAVDLMGNCDPVIRLENGMVLLAGFGAGKGKVLVFTSGMSASWSDMAVSTFFIPMIFRSISYLSAPAAGHTSHWTGGTVSYQVAGDPGLNYYTQYPTDEREQIVPENENMNMMLRIQHAKLPGHYAFYQEDSLLGLGAVNIHPVESDFDIIDRSDIEKRYPDATVRWLGDESLASAITAFRWGREIWRELLLAGFFLLIAELILGRAGKMKAKS